MFASTAPPDCVWWWRVSPVCLDYWIYPKSAALPSSTFQSTWLGQGEAAQSSCKTNTLNLVCPVPHQWHLPRLSLFPRPPRAFCSLGAAWELMRDNMASFSPKEGLMSKCEPMDIRDSVQRWLVKGNLVNLYHSINRYAHIWTFKYVVKILVFEAPNPWQGMGQTKL